MKHIEAPWSTKTASNLWRWVPFAASGAAQNTRRHSVWCCTLYWEWGKCQGGAGTFKGAGHKKWIDKKNTFKLWTSLNHILRNWVRKGAREEQQKVKAPFDSIPWILGAFPSPRVPFSDPGYAPPSPATAPTKLGWHIHPIAITCYHLLKFYVASLDNTMIYYSIVVFEYVQCMYIYICTSNHICSVDTHKLT
jgi:hypothetical protein